MDTQAIIDVLDRLRRELDDRADGATGEARLAFRFAAERLNLLVGQLINERK